MVTRDFAADYTDLVENDKYLTSEEKSTFIKFLLGSVIPDTGDALIEELVRSDDGREVREV